MIDIAHKLRSRVGAMTHDVIMVALAWAAAYAIRFNFSALPPPFLTRALYLLPLVVVIQAAFFVYLGLYRGVWRFASLPDLVRIIKAVVLGTASIAMTVFLFSRMQWVPRSIFPLYALVLMGLLGAPRLWYRWWKDRCVYAPSGRRVLIIGAGRAGEMLVREMLRDPARPYIPIGFADDDSGKQGRDIHGVRVLGTCAAITQLAADHAVETILIALPSATSAQLRRIVDGCELSAIPFRTLPPMHAVVSGRSALQELREVSIDDLLGREPVALEWPIIRQELAGKTVLVSGGGGSIGAELCRQLAGLGQCTLIIFEHNEFNLYDVEMKLRREYPHLDLHAQLGDVCDTVAVERVLEKFRPDVVFHAAAYKHVPLLQKQVRAAVRNNTLGTRTLAQAADKYGCNVFVLISTDKAVNPTNVMGASKRIAEVFCQNMDRFSGTRFITVRFGNVLETAGSVVPLFREQIAKGGPITVTDPEITRYFMTVQEASQLIMLTSAIGKGSELYVLDMGEPIKIQYLAEQMIRLSGKIPGRDIAIQYIGLRPGEKLSEELFYRHEQLLGTGHEKIMLASFQEAAWPELNNMLDQLAQLCVSGDEAKLRMAMFNLVASFGDDTRHARNVIPLYKEQKWELR